MDNYSKNTSKISKLLKLIDIYQLELGFTHSSLTSYKSTSSGFFSILTMICILSYFMFLASDVWNFKVSIKNSFRKRDLIFDNSSFDLQEQNFDFAVNMQYVGFNTSRSNFLLKFVSLNVYPATLQWKKTDEGTTFNYTFESIQLEKCTESALNGDSAYLEKIGVIGNYYCPTKKNFFLQGGRQSESYSNLGITVSECNQTLLSQFHPGELCAELSEQQEVASKLTVSFVFTNQYFQGENKLEPIQQDYKLITLGVPFQQSFYTYMKYSVNYAILEDSWFFESFNKKNVSYSSIRIGQQYGREQQPYNIQTPYLLLSIQLDENVDISQRTAFNIVAALQSIGGFASVCLGVSKLLFYFTQQFNYYQEMISLLYKQNSRDPGFNQSNLDQELIAGSQRNLEQSARNLDIEESQDHNAKALSRILEQFRIQKNLKISFWTHITQKCRSRSQEIHDYESHQTLLKMELNIEAFIKKMRMLELFFNLGLSKAQQTIIMAISQNRQASEAHSESEQSRTFQTLCSGPDPQEFEYCLTNLVQVNQRRQASRFDKRLAKYLGFKFGRDYESHLQQQTRKTLVKRSQKDSHLLSQNKPQASFKRIKKGVQKLMRNDTVSPVQKIQNEELKEIEDY